MRAQCSSCEEFNLHDHTHTFLKIRTPIPLINDVYQFIPAPPPRLLELRALGNGPSTATPTTVQQQLDPRFVLHDRGIAAIQSPQTGTTYINAPSPAFVDSVNQFAFKLLHSIATSGYPCGIASANIYRCLMMAAAGSQGLNLDAFSRVLGFNTSEVSVYGAIKDIVQLDEYCKPNPRSTPVAAAAAAGSDIELDISSSIWYGKSFLIEPIWAGAMSTVFKATLAPQDARAMNLWVHEKTRGKIAGLVAEEEVSDVDIKLVTSLYFKAKWAVPFERSNTRVDRFRSFGSDHTDSWAGGMPCHMMHRTSEILYWEDNIAQMCVLPYKNGNTKPHHSPFLPLSAGAAGAADASPTWNAAIILPKTPGVGSVLAILSHFSASPSVLRPLLVTSHSDTTSGQSWSLKPTFLHLSLPRFTLKQSTDISEPLFNLGLRPICRPSPDFAPISRSQPAYVTNIKHDLFVEVNEEGTEVAVVTSSGVFGSAASAMRVPVAMRVDRPFLFFVFDAGTGVVLCSSVVSEVGKGEQEKG
ncbi:hypothetical protein PAAG_05958 [Paracoccidioides lutzii Pb01]|uniref:Serpin domain-containing protein n=1 Tax=Paracoccidioides lutzii (strain ATCC MYA-826 / Pb01) TaxID=502779 RepID=C1H5B7_PARBA|nr:hypothetical protein PAAG_05958 [Paracoccidioides lutzii Pb01]EEH34911.1 hypothetical protein PAAG_05958 [Paracoccidioides lutzii Pb01]